MATLEYGQEEYDRLCLIQRLTESRFNPEPLDVLIGFNHILAVKPSAEYGIIYSETMARLFKEFSAVSYGKNTGIHLHSY